MSYSFISAACSYFSTLSILCGAAGKSHSEPEKKIKRQVVIKLNFVLCLKKKKTQLFSYLILNVVSKLQRRSVIDQILKYILFRNITKKEKIILYLRI